MYCYACTLVQATRDTVLDMVLATAAVMAGQFTFKTMEASLPYTPYLKSPSTFRAIIVAVKPHYQTKCRPNGVSYHQTEICDDALNVQAVWWLLSLPCTPS